MNYEKMTERQLLELQTALVASGNLNAATEVSDFRDFFGKTVRVVKGRKVPKGTTGKCFWIKRYDYSRYGDPWGIYSSTRIGIKTPDGEVYFTSVDNVIIDEEK